jgi:hypothetical protein
VSYPDNEDPNQRKAVGATAATVKRLCKKGTGGANAGKDATDQLAADMSGANTQTE